MAQRHDPGPDWITRRRFHRGAAALALGAAHGALPRGAAADDHAAEARRGPYIDIHTHIGQVWNTQPPLSVDGLLEWMDESRVERAVVLPLVSPESSSYPITTDFVLRETEAHRDRLIPFCCIDPRTSYQGGRRGLIDVLREWADRGARGFGEHKPGVAIDDDRNLRLYDACAEVGLPVLFHLDNERNLDKPGLPGLGRVLREFPDLPFIGHAPGWWASISGDVTAEQFGRYPGGQVAAGGAIDRLMDEHANLYGDLSAGSGHNAIARDPGFGRRFLIRRADRLLFGTDYLHPGQHVPQLAFYPEVDLPDDVRARIYRDNARDLLGLA